MEHRKSTIEEIEQIIKSDEIDRLIGTEESSFFEFREYPYFTDLNKPENPWTKMKSKFELLRDISSISNSGGGIICLGLIPKQKETEKIEFVKEVCGIKEENILIGSWLEIVANNLVPRFNKTYLEWGYSGKEKKIFWMKIADAKKIGCYPFLIPQDQWMPEKEYFLKGTVYGIYFRDGPQNTPIFSPHKLQEQLAILASNKGLGEDKGEKLNSVKLDRILSLMESDKSKIEENPDDKKKEIISYAEEKLDQTSDIFYLLATPVKKIIIPNFWTKGEKTLYNLLKNPPTLRRMGWDLNVAFSEYPEPGNDAWEIMNGNRKILRVSKDGEIFAGGTIQEFLNWGLRDEKNLINAFAFVEYLYSFFNFLKEFSIRYADDKNIFNISLGFRTKGEKNYNLHIPNQIAGFLGGGTHGPWKKKELIIGHKTFNEVQNPELLTGTVVQEIYASIFGFAKEELPFLKRVEEGFVFDKEIYLKNQ
jgi:hypothetical protein